MEARVHQFALVPLEIERNKEPNVNKIQSIAQYSNKLVIVYELEDKRVRFCFFKLTNSSGVVKAEKDGNFTDIGFGDFNCQEVKAFHDSLILYLRDVNDSVGSLCIWPTPGVGSPMAVVEDCDRYALNNSRDKPQSLVYTKGTVIYYVENPFDAENKKEIDLEEDILSISLNYPKALVILQKSICILDIEDPSNRISMAIQLDNRDYSTRRPSPTSISASNTNFNFYIQNSASQFSHNMSSNLKKVEFDSIPYTNTKIARLAVYFSTTEKYSYFYDFVNQPFVTPSLDLQSSVAIKVENKDITFFANEKSVYQLFDVHDSFDFLTRDQTKDLISKLPSLDVATVCSFFQVAWNFTERNENSYPYRNQALKLLAYPEFRRHVLDILTIFSKLHFYVEKENQNEEEEETSEQSKVYVEYEPKYFAESQRDHSESSLVAVLNALRQHCPKEVKNTGNPKDVAEMQKITEVFTTAILEILILEKKTAEISTLIKSKSGFDKETIIRFMDTIPDHSTRLIVYSLLGEAKLAMQSFALTTDRSTEVIDIVIGLLKANSGNWDFIKDHADPFIKYDPIRGMEILTDPRVDMNKATAYVTENFPDYKKLFLIGAVHNPSLVARETIIRNLADDFSASLVSLHKPNFDHSTVSYLKCVLRSPNGHPPIEDLEHELSDYLQNLVSNFFNELDKAKLLSNVANFTSSSLKISIFLIADKYKEALDIIWENNGGNPEKAAQSCRDCSNPPKAFELLIEKMKASLSQDEFLKELTKLLTKNIDIIDVSYALGSLDKQASLDTTLKFVEQLYRSLIATKRDAEIEAAHAQAEQFEAQYMLLRAQADMIEINEDTVCDACGKKLGNTYFERTPTGNLYHISCINKQ